MMTSLLMKNAEFMIQMANKHQSDELGLPVHLSELGIKNLPIEEMVEKATKKENLLPRAYRQLTKEDCAHIYSMCL